MCLSRHAKFLKNHFYPSGSYFTHGYLIDYRLMVLWRTRSNLDQPAVKVSRIVIYHLLRSCSSSASCLIKAYLMPSATCDDFAWFYSGLVLTAERACISLSHVWLVSLKKILFSNNYEAIRDQCTFNSNDDHEGRFQIRDKFFVFFSLASRTYKK